MKKIKPGDPVYAVREGYGLGLAFQAIVLGVTRTADSHSNGKATVLDISVPGRPRVTVVDECHPDSSVSPEQAHEILIAYGYSENDERTPSEILPLQLS